MADRILWGILAVLWFLGAVLIAVLGWKGQPLGGAMTTAAIFACVTMAIDIVRERL